MADTDLIARVYALGESTEYILEKFEKSIHYVAPLVQRRKPEARGERASTEPPLDCTEVPHHHYLPCIELQFGNMPPSRHGIIFGADERSDVANYLIVKDLGSLIGTQVMYGDQGSGIRSGFQWIIGGHPVLEGEGKGKILITIFSEPRINLEIVVTQHDIESSAYIDKVNRFREGLAATEDLFADLDIPNRRDTRRPTGAHTPSTGDIYLTKLVGEGSFAVVTHFWNVGTGAEHVLKEPSEKALRKGLVDVNQWRQERHIMGLISHPNIVRLLDSECTGRPWLRLEYVPGGSLAEQQDISATESVLILRQLTAALEHLHGLDIVHRDMKTENILVQYRTPDHIQVKLADFGLSKDYSNLSTFCGNRQHLAAEVFNNEYLTQIGVKARKSYNSAVDIWSLGTVVYGLLCPFPPWEESYMKGMTWAEKILDRFGKDAKERPNKLKCFLLQAMVVIQPEQRWSAKDCLLAAESICIPVPECDSEQRISLDQGEQSTIIQNGMWRAAFSSVASGSMAARDHAGSGAPTPGSPKQVSRKRQTTMSTSSSSPKSHSKRRGNSSNAAQPVLYISGNRTYGSGKERYGDGQAATCWPAHHSSPWQDGLEIDSSPITRSRSEGDDLAQHPQLQDAAEALETFGAVDLLQQMRQHSDTNEYVELVRQSLLRHTVDPPNRKASHLSTRDLMIDRSDLVYMVIRRQAISMRISDFQLNASQILTAANLQGNARDKWQNRLKRLCVTSQAGPRRSELWVQFRDGVFLCQALGLEDALKPLLLYPSLPLPPRSENYLPESSGEFAKSQHENRVIADQSSKKVFNIIHLLEASNIAQNSLQAFFEHYPDIAKEVVEGEPEIAGIYIDSEKTPLLCDYFGINFAVVKDLLAGELITTQKHKHQQRRAIQPSATTQKSTNADITQPRRYQNTAEHNNRADKLRPRCNECISKHKRCDRGEICSNCNFSGMDCIYDSAIAGRGPRLRPENVKGATYKNLLPAPTKPNQPTDKDLSTTGRLHGGTKLDIQMKESADKKLLNQDYSSAKLFTAINDVDGTNVHDEQTIPPTKVSQISYFTETKNESFLPQIKGSFMQAVQPKLSYTHKAIVSEHSEHGGSNESLGNF